MHSLSRTMKAIIFFFLVSFTTFGQQIKNDTLEFVYYTDKLGHQKKAMIAYPMQILIVNGDSIYTVLNEGQFKDVVAKGVGFNILNNPDSIALFLRNRIKAIVILKKGN